MFDWLANLLVKIPIQGHACACCEAKKEKLKQMQKEILDIKESNCCIDVCNCNEKPINNDNERFTMSYRYKL